VQGMHSTTGARIPLLSFPHSECSSFIPRKVANELGVRYVGATPHNLDSPRGQLRVVRKATAMNAHVHIIRINRAPCKH
jgi:hypothetical protein